MITLSAFDLDHWWDGRPRRPEGSVTQSPKRSIVVFPLSKKKISA